MLDLVPVEHDPFAVQLVPVDHDPFARQLVPVDHDPFASATASSGTASSGNWFWDQIKSIPGGIVQGIANTASASGKAAADEQGFADEVPDADETDAILEKNVTGPLPGGGAYGRSVGEMLGNPASYIGPDGLPVMLGRAVLGGIGSEVGNEIAGWPGRILGGLAGELGTLGTWARIGARAPRTRVNDPPPLVQDEAPAGSASGAAIEPKSAAAEFSPAERDVINEAGSIMGAPQFAELRAAHQAGQPAIVNVGGRVIRYEPELPMHGMSAFGDDGFYLGPKAFASDTDIKETVLHELHRLHFSEGMDGVSGELAARETKAADDFATRAAGTLP